MVNLTSKFNLLEWGFLGTIISYVFVGCFLVWEVGVSVTLR